MFLDIVRVCMCVYALQMASDRLPRKAVASNFYKSLNKCLYTIICIYIYKNGRWPGEFQFVHIVVAVICFVLDGRSCFPEMAP